MNDSTRLQLQAIDEAFYRHRAVDFAAKRTRPWSGWDRVLEAAAQRPDASETLSILDLGCGHGRFAKFALEAAPPEPRFLGVDSSAELLEIAQSETGLSATHFEQGDLLEEGLWQRIDARGEPAFDLITAFGLFHHLPALENRHRLLRRCRERMSHGGLLAISFWQFGDSPRFQRKLLSEEKIRGLGIEPSDLESGDHLMIWGDATALQQSAPSVRYCHYASPDEALALIAGAGFEPIATYHADGKSGVTNYYVLATFGDLEPS